MYESIINKKTIMDSYIKKGISSVKDSLYEVILNVCDRCNRKCLFCPRGNGYAETSKLINYEVVDKVCSDLGKNWSGLFSLSGFGEPCLNKNLPEIIDILKTKTNAKVMLITNGDFYDAIKDLDINTIEISCYSEKDFNRLKKQHFKSPVFLKKQYEKGFTWFNNRAGNIPGKSHCTNVCFICMMKMFIDTNGDVLQCCSDWKREHILGNILQDSIYNIWQYAYKKDRLLLLNNNRSACKLCSKCNALGNLYGNEFGEFWSRWYSNN